MIKEIIQLRDALYKKNNNFKQAGIYWSTGNLDKLIYDLDIIIQKETKKNRERKARKTINRKKLISLLENSSEKHFLHSNNT